MRNKLFIIMSLVIIASMVLAACQTATPTPEKIVEKVIETVVVTEVVEGETIEVVKEVVKEVVVTPTPEPAAAPAEVASAAPATFVQVTIGEPETFDPALAYETAGGEIIQNVYEGLVFYNKDQASEFVPQLATDWTISDDGKVYTFNIRQGVKFHNGNDLTPSDVAYSFQRGVLQGGTASPQWMLTEPFFGVGVDDISVIVDPEGSLYDDAAALQAFDPAAVKAACEQTKAAVVADDAAGTVTITLAQSWGPFLATIAQSWGAVMDQDWVVENGGWDGSCDTWQNFYAITSENDPFTEIANGTGPFTLESWTHNQEIVLARNDNYWRTEPAWEGGPVGPAAFERVVIKSVNEWGTRFAMLQAGDADFAVVPRENVGQVDPMLGELCNYNNETNTFDACEPAAADQPLRLFIGHPTVSRTDIFLNFDIVTEGGNPLIGSGALDGNGVPPDFFQDLHVRKAFNYCFDWETFIQDALVGEAVQSIGIPLPGMPGYEQDGPIYTFDLDKCAEEFQLADLDKDGIPAGEDTDDVWSVGFRMQVAYNIGNTNRQIISEILASTLAEVNELFSIEIVGLPWPTFLRNQRARTLPMFVSGWLEDIHDPHNWYVPYLTGTYGRRQSLPQEALDEFQALINAGVSESDPAKRQVIYSELNQKVFDLAPQVILAIPTGRHYEQRWVEGWYYNPIYPGNYFYALSKK